MTPTTFYKLVLSLWGEEWRPELDKLLAQHGMKYSRMSVRYWRAGKRSIPEEVADLLESERKGRKRKSVNQPKRKETT